MSANLHSVLKIYIFTAILPLFVFSCKNEKKAFYNFAPEAAKTLTVFSTLDKDETEMLSAEFENLTGIWVQTHCAPFAQIHEDILSLQEQNQSGVLFCDFLEAAGPFKELLSDYVKNNTVIPRLYGNKACAAVCATPAAVLYNPHTLQPEKVLGWIADSKNMEKTAVLNPLPATENYACLYQLLASCKHLEHEIKTASGSFNLLKTYNTASEAAAAVSEETVYAAVLPENKALYVQKLYPGIQSVPLYPEKKHLLYQVCAIIHTKKNEDTENEERFIAFLQSRETQQFLEEHFFYRSVRTDMNSSNALETAPQKEIDSMNAMRPEILQWWMQNEKGVEK